MKNNIRDLQNFLQVAQCSTISEAAKLLGIGQPALSDSIKKLEINSGQILLFRSRSGIQLTPFGRVFLQKTKKIVLLLEDLENSHKESSVFGSQKITIGCHPVVAQYVLPRALAKIKAQAPDFKVELRHNLSRVVQTEIQQGRIDVGVVVNPVFVPDIKIKKIATDTVSVWSAKGVKNLDILFCNQNLIQTQAILKKWKNKPENIISTESLELIGRLVASELGCGILPRRAVEISELNLVEVANSPMFKDDICVLHRPEFGKSATEKLVIESLSEALS